MVADLLSQFPAGWNYVNAPNEEKDRFYAVLGELLADELTMGLAASKEIDDLIAAARAQLCLQWLDGARANLRQMVAAEHFVNDHPEADVQREVDKAAKAAAKAEKQLLEATAARDQAVLVKMRAAAVQQELAAAQTLLATGDITLCAAFAHLHANV